VETQMLENENIRRSPEGRVLLTGLLLAAAYIIALGLSGLFSFKYFRLLATMTVTNIFFGRAPCISFGYAMHLPHIIVIPVTLLIEVIIVLIVYPLFVFSLQRLMVVKVFGKLLTKIREAAEKNHKIVSRYGVPGLFVFVWIPFHMTGPAVGCVIGYLLGIPMWLNLTVVLGGTSLAIACWALLIWNIQNSTIIFNPFIPFFIFLSLAVMAAAVRFVLKKSRETGL